MTDWYISIKKGIYVFVMAGIAELIIHLANITTVDPYEAGIVAVLLAVLRTIQDAYKHKGE